MAGLYTDQTLLNTTPEALNLQRQRKMAEALTSQSFNQPQGQMISGHYVAPSWTQFLAPVVAGAAGAYAESQLDKKELKLAEALRGKQKEAVDAFTTAKTPKEKFTAATSEYAPAWLKSIGAEMLKTQKAGEGDVISQLDLETGAYNPILKGAPKYHAPTTVDMGTMGTKLIYPDGRTEIIPKGVQGPAGQVVETANGPMLINTRTGAAQPIMVNGQQLQPKLSPEQSKDITAINQQVKTIDGAIEAIKKNPSVFSYSRGLAGDMPKGETIAARYQKPEETAARSYVFNNVSAVIKERAGTAQSAGEAKRLNSFLPDTYDDAQTIINKFEGFKTYLKDLEAGTRQNPNIPSTPKAPEAPGASKTTPVDPALLQFMTPEQKALFGVK